MSNFGIRLKELRTQSSMTQKHLADKLGITKATVSYYENGERAPSPEILVKLATIFHVSTDFLLGMEHSSYLDTTGLTEGDIQTLRYLVSYLLLKNKQSMPAIDNPQP